MKGNSSRIELAAILCGGVAIAAIGVYIVVHSLASFAFPIPWADEAHFLWQAAAFAKGNNLFAPEQHEARSILWMPPGYMVLFGLIFKVTGFSLAIARMFSMVFTIGAFLALLLLTRHLRCRAAVVVLLSLFLVNRFFIVSGNVARMESLLLLLACCGYLLIATQHYVKGLALLIITPLIHPNGLYLAVFAVFFVLVRARLKAIKESFCPSDLLAVAVTMAAWLAYAHYVQHHWEEFRLDMGYQIARKASRDVVGTFLGSKWAISLSLAVLGTLVLSFRSVTRPALLAFLAAGAGIIQRIGLEMWYDVYDALAILLVSILVLHFGDDLLERLQVRRVMIRSALSAILLLALVLCNVHIGMIESPIGYPWKISWGGMRIQRHVSYIADSDIQTIKAFIVSQKIITRPLIVEFFPEGDGLFFHDIEDESLRIVSEQFGPRPVDLCLIHVSRYVPAWLEPYMMARFRQAGFDPSDNRHLILQRDETERWYVGPGIFDGIKKWGFIR